MYTLQNLPFPTNAFSDWTSEETFSFHHGKHHAGYVNKLNAVLEGHELAGKPLEEVVIASRGNAKIFNVAAQHFNHSFFWECLSPEGGEPAGLIKEQIERDFGSVPDFQMKFSDVAATLFGSGWTWLVRDISGALNIEQTKDAETPLGVSGMPLLTLDVWEHAYYIDHRNNRQAFIEGFWKHINWENVSARLKA